MPPLGKAACVAALLACGSAAGCQDPKGGDDSAPGVDVSGDLCAGLTDESGEEIVPSTSTNGCTEGDAYIGVYCLDCEFAAGSTISLVAVRASDGARAVCASTDLSSATVYYGLAPFGGYTLQFEGAIEPGSNPRMDDVQFTMCSEEVQMVAVVYDVP